jgi:magnesium-transporting ATPase (P-type)
MFRIAPLKTKEDEEKAFHLMSFDELKRKFDINLSKGLDSSRVVTLRKKYGKNQIKVSNFRLVKAVTADLFDYLSIMLWISAIMSVLSYKPFGSPPLLSNLITAIILFASLFAKACLAFYQSFNSIESLRGFHSSKECLVHVMRDGETKLVSSFDLVIGDLVFLLPNNRVPAVLRLIEVKGLVLNKSALTGETGHVEATSQKYNIDNKVIENNLN